MIAPEMALYQGTHSWNFYWQYAVFLVNEWTLRSDTLRKWIWEQLKTELFFIGGQCIHSGQCCRHIMLVDHGVPITKMSHWNTFRKADSRYSPFRPVVRSNDKIDEFNCGNLNRFNLCSDYTNRPDACRNYPVSAFLTTGKLNDGCGFYIQKRSGLPHTLHPKLIELMSKVGAN